MLGKVLNGLRYRLINVFSSSTEEECATCHETIKQAEYFTRIGEFKYCIGCRPVKAVSSPANLKTDRVKNEMLQHKHRKVDAATRQILRERERAEFRRGFQPQEERTTEPIRTESIADVSENVRVFKISKFTPSQIMRMDTALIAAYRETQNQA